jgi:hypothetical protein
MLYLKRSYVVGDKAGWGRAIVIIYLSSTTYRDINRLRRYLTRRYGARMEDLSSIRLTGEDFLINIPNKLSPWDIVND